MSWEYDNADMRRMLRRVMLFLEKRHMLYLLPLDVTDWWIAEKGVIAKERNDATGRS